MTKEKGETRDEGKAERKRKDGDCDTRSRIKSGMTMESGTTIGSGTLKILDVGCGGGLVAENIAKMGVKVTGIDASEKNIKVAQIHAEESGIDIEYRQGLVENEKGEYDVVLALEIVEHVDNVKEFLKNCAKLVKKDGLLFVATLNRTLKSLLLAKIGAEYVLRWMPIGTHEFKKFLKPSEIDSFLNNCDVSLKESCGFSYNLFKDEWREARDDLDVNYVMVFKKNG